MLLRLCPNSILPALHSYRIKRRGVTLVRVALRLVLKIDSGVPILFQVQTESPLPGREISATQLLDFGTNSDSYNAALAQ
ncbi:hypothetical protein CC2G_003612 [Coprinopsis cinerea AmutBmut pab1-1]|nr:hypothetical protein CC2G_003612 [Coprinopsis cinerea AmutBmut pab1-1]